MSTRARAMLAPSKTPITVKLSSPASDLSTRYSRMIPLGVVGGVRVMSTRWAVLVMNGAGTPSGTANKEYCIISGIMMQTNLMALYWLHVYNICLANWTLLSSIRGRRKGSILTNPRTLVIPYHIYFVFLHAVISSFNCLTTTMYS